MTWLVKGTTAFKREYKLMQKRAVNMQLLQDIVIKLANGDTLPEFFVSFRVFSWLKKIKIHLQDVFWRYTVITCNIFSTAR